MSLYQLQKTAIIIIDPFNKALNINNLTITKLQH